MAGAFDRWNMRDDYTEERIDELERDLLGMSLTSVYSSAAVRRRHRRLEVLDRGRVRCRDGRYARGGRGEVTAVKEHIDSKGNEMAFVDLVYGPNHFVFSHFWAEFGELLQSHRPVLITGVKSTHNGRTGLRVESLPPDANGEQTPPIMDLAAYVELIGDEAEAEVAGTVYPEDWIGQDAVQTV
jgi:DNA polymerase III alpha subunit